MKMYDQPSVRLGYIGQQSRRELAKRAMSHARNYGRVMVCRDANGAVWSIWVDCRDAQRVLAEMPETVCGTFEPSTTSMTKTCRRFVDDVVEALTD